VDLDEEKEDKKRKNRKEVFEQVRQMREKQLVQELQLQKNTAKERENIIVQEEKMRSI
jgi:hypothetical protein